MRTRGFFWLGKGEHEHKIESNGAKKAQTSIQSNKTIGYIQEKRKEQKAHLCSLVLLGKHCSKDGRGRKSGEAGSTVCFLCLVFSEFVDGGSNVNVALGPEKEGGQISFFHVLAEFPVTSKPGKKEVLGNLDVTEWFAFLHTSDVIVVCTDAIFGTI